MLPFKHMEWKRDYLYLLDQTLLPNQEKYLHINSVELMADAIKKLRIRGAPAIGVAAAYGLVIGAKTIKTDNLDLFKIELDQIGKFLIEVRPTAVNLQWAIKRLLNKVITCKSTKELIGTLEQEAITIHEEDKILCKKIGENGASIFSEKKINILTHCNAGALATGGQGTALSVIYELKNNGFDVNVFADETRPLLQGTRLTAWELQQTGIPVTVICDNMAASVMRQEKVDCVIVGADRIANNGDVANKIGTFSVAISAAKFGIPFYVAAPYSTFDLTLDSGDLIPIEEREPYEITSIMDKNLAPKGIKVYNPAFDVTPNKLITAIITDKGIIDPPFFENIRKNRI
jgi:methylthioribose-1-phosphate isomerase